jgi:hypothetical protein
MCDAEEADGGENICRKDKRMRLEEKHNTGRFHCGDHTFITSIRQLWENMVNNYGVPK